MTTANRQTWREKAGGWLQRWLTQPESTWFGHMALAADGHFNLQYLADRLQHERRAIRDYVGDIAQLPATPEARISVVSPVYGIKLRYVRAFVRSIQRQSYRNWELCVCLDGDPDIRIQRFLDQLTERDPSRFRLVVHDQNRGISAATESAIGISTGCIVTFADADDALHVDALAVVAKAFASDDDVDVAYTNSDICAPWGYRMDPLYKPAWSSELLLSCNYMMHLVAVRRALLRRCDNLWKPEFDGAQDWNMVLRVTRLARRIHHIPIVLYHWRALEGSTATAMDVKPWARQAARYIQETGIAELDQRLCRDFDHPTFPVPIRFRDQQAPPLHVIEFHLSDDAPPPTSSASVFAYPGAVDLTAVGLAGPLDKQAAALDSAVDALPGGEGLVLFISAEPDLPTLHGPIETQAAMAVLPGVACVWPFFNRWRGVYTVKDNQLMPRLHRSSYFTPLTGNVLTGPLHGLMLERESWKTLGGFQAQVPGNASAEQSVHALGALLGLAALRQRLRNVAVSNVTSEWQPPALDLGVNTPSFDPYV